MSSLKIATWSVRGIQSLSLRQMKIDLLLNTNFDMIFTQELRLKTCEDIHDVSNLWTKGQAVISIGEDSADGVGIFFASQHVTIIRKRELVPGRLLMVV